MPDILEIAVHAANQLPLRYFERPSTFEALFVITEHGHAAEIVS